MSSSKRGLKMKSNCCGAAIIEDTDFCADCKEHCEGVNDEDN